MREIRPCSSHVLITTDLLAGGIKGLFNKTTTSMDNMDRMFKNGNPKISGSNVNDS